MFSSTAFPFKQHQALLSFSMGSPPVIETEAWSIIQSKQCQLKAKLSKRINVGGSVEQVKVRFPVRRVVGQSLTQCHATTLICKTEMNTEPQDTST